VAGLLAGVSRAFAGDVGIEGYNYFVTDVRSKGLTAQEIYDSMSTNWMDLEHSVCANRAHVWSYDLHRKYGINTGTIFIFFGAKVWENQKHSYWYHAGTYVVENGKELVMEQSYPSEVSRPLSVVDWMDNEMEGRVTAAGCIELKKDVDQDMTSLFYYQDFLPNERSNGKLAFDCYYRKVPGFIPYPETVAELELGLDEYGKKTDNDLKDFDRDILVSACVDAFSGKNFFKKAAAWGFCKDYI